MFYATGLPGWTRFGGYAAPWGYPLGYQKPDPQLEQQALKSEAEDLQAELELVKKRLGEIESGSQAE